MSTELLRNRAGSLVKQANHIRSRYDFNMIKPAALNSLVEMGVEPEKAEELLKQAEAAIPQEAAEFLKQAAFLDKEADILIKVAAVIEDQESKIQEANERYEELQKEAQYGSVLDTLQNNGNFTQSEMDVLKSLPEEMLTKLASDQAPMDMGRPGQRQEPTDSLLAFCLS